MRMLEAHVQAGAGAAGGGMLKLSNAKSAPPHVISKCDIKKTVIL